MRNMYDGAKVRPLHAERAVRRRPLVAPAGRGHRRACARHPRGDLERPRDARGGGAPARRRACHRAAVSVTMALLQRGRERFDIYCSPCHSVVGDGDGMVVRRGFPAPPSYHIERLRAAPDRHFYDVMTDGYGVMYPTATASRPRIAGRSWPTSARCSTALEPGCGGAAMSAFLHSWLFAWLFLLGISLGALANLMIHSLTGGRWGEAMRPPLAAAARLLPVAGGALRAGAARRRAVAVPVGRGAGTLAQRAVLRRAIGRVSRDLDRARVRVPARRPRERAIGPTARRSARSASPPAASSSTRSP